MTRGRKRAAVVLASVFYAMTSIASAQTVWDKSYDAALKERFIPIELWTGAEWDGARELKMTLADIRFGDRAQKEIKGPVEWKHPNTGETILVYERTNQEKSGVKVEFFAMNEAKNGLGRVYDSRATLGTRTFTGGLKFPLGYWKQGETRKFSEKRYGDSKIETRIESITIIKLDFTYNGAPHCLEFEWLYRDGAGKTVDHQTYTYCPNQAMVKQVQH
ncbi:MAG TPA: hypothetical protein VI231_20765 [Candidatus Binatia bacterium]|jgi:hypothetical protein